MPEMTEYERDCFKDFLTAYKHQWDLNQYARDAYDEDLEYYCGYRNANQYPLAYNMVFNKLLPRVYTIMSRFMDQVYQTGHKEVISAAPRKSRDVERAPRVQGLLNFQWENMNDIDTAGGGYLTHFTWMFNAMTFGKGITKGYWRKEERIAPQRITVPVPKFDRSGRLVDIEPMDIVMQTPQIAYDAPYVEVLHNKTFVPHPHYRNIQQMPRVFCVYKRRMDYLKQMADKGIFKNLDKLGWSGTKPVSSGSAAGSLDSGEAIAKSLEIEGAMTSADLQSEKITPEVDIVEGYGRYIFPEDESPYEVGAGYKIKGKESEAIVHIGNYATLLSMQKNPYGIRPFFDISAYMQPELYWDIGLIRLGKGIQEQYNTLANARFQNAIMLGNPMIQVRYDAEIDPQALVWKPFGIVPVEQIDADVKPLVVPDTHLQTFREQEQFFESTIEEMTGLYKYAMGSTPERQEHVGTIYSLQSMAEARTRLLLMTMDYQGFSPLLKYLMLLNSYHLPNDFEARIQDVDGTQFVPMFSGDLHPDYDFHVRYTALEPALGKQFRIQQLLQFAQIWAQSPYLQQYEFVKATLELLDRPDAARFVKTPEQLQQEQQQQMQAQMFQLAIQDALAQRESDRTMQREMMRGLMSS